LKEGDRPVFIKGDRTVFIKGDRTVFTMKKPYLKTFYRRSLLV
jgi:hypothetical protein